MPSLVPASDMPGSSVPDSDMPSSVKTSKVVPDNDLPSGGVAKQPDFYDQLGTSLKQSFVGPGNLADRAISGLAGGAASLFGQTDDADKIFKEMEERIAQRNQWANPDNVKPRAVASVLGAIPNLPSNVLTGLFSPFETGQNMVKNGEKLSTAQGGAAISGIGNMLGYGLPMGIGRNLAQKAVTGAISQAAQSYGSGKALAGISDTPESQKEFEPTAQSVLNAAAQGAVFGGAMGHTIGKEGNIPVSENKVVNGLRAQKAAEEVHTPTSQEAPLPDVMPVTPEGQAALRPEDLQWRQRAAQMQREAQGPQQLELPLENSSQQIAEMQNPGQGDLFGPNNPTGRNYTDQWKANENVVQRSLQDGVDAANQDAAQRAVEARQRALEQQVAQQGGLDRNAAERARQEQAPTGYNDWQEAQRQAANTRLPGDNTPLDMQTWNANKAKTSVDINDFPQALQDHTLEQPGLDFTQDNAARMSFDNPKNIAASVMDILNKPFPSEVARNVSDIVAGRQPSDVSAQVMRVLNGPGRNQSGVLNVKDITDAAADIGRRFAAFGKHTINPLSPEEELVTKNAGINYNPRGADPQSIIQNALKEGKDAPSGIISGILKNWQSGLGSYADKVQSSAAQGVARWLSWAEKEGGRAFREQVQPIEKSMSKLSRSDLQDVMSVMKEEMFNKDLFTDAQLTKAGMSPEAQAARKQLRQAYSDVLTKLNASRAILGLDPIKAEQAYFSSMWTGNWHVPVYDKTGALAWYLKTESRSEANKAIKWLGENHGDTIDTSSLKPEFKPNEDSRLPKDMTDTYGQMMDLFKGTPIGDAMAKHMEDYKAEQAFNTGGFKVHFEKKANVRGFIGDRPWLSDHENAVQGAKAQMNYLKQANRWAPTQEALANVKQIIASPELQAQQPQNMDMIKAYTGQALGVTGNLLKGVENVVAKAVGRSPGTLMQATSSLKSLTYLQQLGASAGYSIATPTQAFILGPSRHMMLSSEGYKHNPIITMMKSTAETAQILTAHAGSVLGKNWTAGLSDVGQKAMRYMEDNGIINVNLFDEYSNLGENRAIQGLKSTLGYTISAPEKVARVSTFMSFVHHLNDSGVFKGNETELFQKAEDLTNATLTNMNRSARPLAVQKAGLLGELAYTYKSPMINYYNQLSTLARRGMETKNPLPFLMAALVMPAALGGVMDIPLAQELDSGWNMVKSLIAKHYPQYSPSVEGVGIKEALLRSGSDAATYGLVSKAFGAQMASRFSNQVVDPENPLGNIAPVAQEIKEQAGIVGSLAPLAAGELPNSTDIGKALWQNAPPMGKGALEVFNDRFKSGPPKGNIQGTLNPNNLTKKSYDRTRLGTQGAGPWGISDEAYRLAGLTSLPEARTKDVRYQNNKESQNANAARESSINLMWQKHLEGNDDGMEKYARAYFNNHGDGADFNKDFTNAVLGSNMTPEELQDMHATTLSKVMDLKRRMEMTK